MGLPAIEAIASRFESINRGYDATCRPGRLTLGLVVPLENHGASAIPTMAGQLDRIRQAEALGFASLWLRDVPFNVPSFGDAGHLYDPFVYLGLLAAETQSIALGVASVVLPLRHPAHVAKAAASVDALSGGRLLLGVASGDRPEEYPAMAQPFEARGARFRASYDYLRGVAAAYPTLDNDYGRLDGRVDLLPKPAGSRLPLLITGGSQQSPDWLARHGDGWMLYPREVAVQSRIVADWRGRRREDRPVMQPLYVDLLDDPAAPARPIHLGFRSGSRALVGYLRELESIGLNHVALNLRFQSGTTEDALSRLADTLLPHFPSPRVTE